MLIIISDLHFSDGTTSSNVVKDVFSQILFPEIRLRLGSLNKNIEEINMVLLGDIFDIVRSDKWLIIDDEKRPWNGKLDPLYAVNINPEVENIYNSILKEILKAPGCISFLNELKNLAAACDIPLKITYVIGNHDRAFNIYESLQNKVKNLLSGINVVICNFLHSEKYAVLCRHGHEWDEACFGYQFAKRALSHSHRSRFHPEYYKVQNLGEVVTAEIMGGLVHRLNNLFQWKGKHDSLIEHIKDINNVRPALSALKCLIWSTSGDFDREMKGNIIEALCLSLESFLNTDYVRLWAKAFTNNYINGDVTGHLQLLLNLLQEENFNSLAKALDFFQDITRYFKVPADNYLKGAMADLKKYPDVKFVIYGHTHQAKEVIIESDKVKGTFRYINTGTYLPQIQEAKVNGFGMSKRMTLTFIYSPDEDGGVGEQGSVSIEMRSVKG